MSEDNVKPADVTPVAPVVNPAKGSATVDNIDLKTADLATLKAAFEVALVERAAIDSRIDGLRKAISARLREFQLLNDTVSNINYTGRKSLLTIPSINWGKVWSFVLGWLVPAMILFVLLWYGVSAYRARYSVPNPDGRIPIEQSIIPGHNVMDQTLGSLEDELWS